MDGIFGGIRDLQFFNSKQIVVENLIFRLLSKITVAFLLSCSILCTCYAFIGIPMLCMTKDDIPEDVISTYCWIHNTFSVEKAWRQEVGEEVIYPGISSFKNGDKRVFHTYYQWVPFVLLIQACMCYIGKYVWSTYEDNRIQNISQSLNNPVLDKITAKEQRKNLFEYVKTHLKKHNKYFIGYAFAEIINFVIIVGQMFLMDTFLGGYFSTYGSDVLTFTEYDWSVRYDPMIRVFPRVAKCTFHRYGPSGDVQKHDSLCILPLNIVNEKIYVFLWFWFVILAVLTGLSIVYRVVSSIVPRIRATVLYSRSLLCDRDELNFVVRGVSLGDYMILKNLSSNIDPIHFSHLISKMAGELQSSKLREGD